MSTVQAGAFCFGAVIGWFTYFVNRYRAEVKLADVASILGAIGGAAVLELFPADTELFGAYGIGLAAGFFLYFGFLLVFVRIDRRNVANKRIARDSSFSVAWFLDGRRPQYGEREMGPANTASRGMSAPGEQAADPRRQR